MAKFALLGYSTNNIGDEVQSIAVRQFLPHVDAHVDREELDTFTAEQQHHIIMNGWYMHRPERWPPSEALNPLILSFHITQQERRPGLERADVQMLRGAGLEFLKAHAPIGARDLHTQRLLQSTGVDSYFSGCMTLTLPAIPVAEKERQIVAVQLPGPAMRKVRWRARAPVVKATHRSHAEGFAERTRMAQERLRLYASSRNVVTDRLHCALPCLAMGVPVLFVDTAPDPYRFEGLRELLHAVSLEDFLANRYDYDINDPPPNKTLHLPIREALIQRVTAFVKEAEAK